MTSPVFTESENNQALSYLLLVIYALPYYRLHYKIVPSDHVSIQVCQKHDNF